MSAQAPLKERIKEESAKGSGKEEGANGSSNKESTNGSSTTEGVKDPSTQASNDASVADKNAKAMTDLMWQDHPSMLAQLPPNMVFVSTKECQNRLL